MKSEVDMTVIDDPVRVQVEMPCPRCSKRHEFVAEMQPGATYLPVYCECSTDKYRAVAQGPFNNFKECVRRARQETK